MGQKLHKRLLPLYAAAFFQGFVIWYAVEKLFMHNIGFTSTQIGTAAILVSVPIVLFSTPFGILADRWSRRGILIIGSMILMASTLVGGLSHSVDIYYWCSFSWGLFFAIYLGTYDSVIYDVLIEDLGQSDQFEHYFGRIKMYDAIALVSASLLSGLVARTMGLRATYFLTIPFVALSILALLKFREPTLHKKGRNSAVLKHTKETIRAVTRGGGEFSGW